MERTRWGLVALIFVGGLLAAAQFGKVSLTLPELALAFDRPITGVAILVSLVGMTGLVLGAIAGGVAAAFGPGRTFLAGLLLGGLASLAQAVTSDFWPFAILRALEGLTHLALVVGGPPLMAMAASERDRPLVMGLWAVFFGASLALSAQIFPVILAMGGLPLLFALHGVAQLAVAALLWRQVPRDRWSWPSVAPIALHAQIYGTIRYVAPGLGFVCYTFLFIASIAFLPEALGRPMLATILPVVTLVSTLAGGALCRRYAPHRVAALGYLGTGVGALAALSGVPGGIEGCFLCMGLIPGASFAAIPAWNRTQADRARATGAIAQLGNLGTVTGTPVFAAIYVVGGLSALMWVVIGTAVLGGLLALWAGQRASGAARAEMVDVP